MKFAIFVTSTQAARNKKKKRRMGDTPARASRGGPMDVLFEGEWELARAPVFISPRLFGR